MGDRMLGLPFYERVEHRQTLATVNALMSDGAASLANASQSNAVIQQRTRRRGTRPIFIAKGKLMIARDMKFLLTHRHEKRNSDSSARPYPREARFHERLELFP
jgi:hypothetical protein